tara:strand:- start:1499 stop:2500 length:1002 start_codon:yes stop_codon:yes gene_type:complete
LKIRSFLAIALIPQILIVNFLKNSPSFINDYYVRLIYNNLIEINLFLFSKIEIPIGEIIYIVIVLLYFYLFIKVISLKLSDFINLLAFSSLLYFLFYFLWGLNYFKQSMVNKFNIKSEYEFNVLDETINKVIFEINKESSFLADDINKSDILNIIKTTNSNIKKSIIPDIFLYQKVSGHYVPFTSEAIFIDKIPMVDIPFVILHEQAHQIGYADEGEASFIAFSEAIKNNEPYIRYSGYFYALINLLNEISKKNSKKLDNYLVKLDEKVISDIKTVQNFWSKYSDNFLNKAQNYIYDLYLKSNNQDAGIMTYGKVSLYIIHYYQEDELTKTIE